MTSQEKEREEFELWYRAKYGAIGSYDRWRLTEVVYIFAAWQARAERSAARIAELEAEVTHLKNAYSKIQDFKIVFGNFFGDINKKNKPEVLAQLMFLSIFFPKTVSENTKQEGIKRGLKGEPFILTMQDFIIPAMMVLSMDNDVDRDEFNKDKDRLDWLADPENNIAQVLLPREIVERNLGSLRDAIDEAMKGGYPCQPST